ncbi:MAG: DegT/DnrJ/EryC1/StrS aminotransferase family protein [Rubrivivax sp.]|nr:DegT/DnrJ/EryC1/StrS aminotransferase family protein [Rubrivivax sp.]
MQLTMPLAVADPTLAQRGADRSPVAQPRGPVLGLASLVGPRRPVGLPWLFDHPRRMFTTSGRAAIHAALRALALPAGSVVSLPRYHCPTLVAPAAALGLDLQFHPLDALGRPELDALEQAREAAQGHLRVLLAAHWFGRVRSLAREREWCDRHGIVLIEDCAHALFGEAGERPVGCWGDYATASLTKFMPVAEGGLLLAAPGRVLPTLARPGLRAQAKALVDVLDRSLEAGRLRGLAWLRPGRRPRPVLADQVEQTYPPLQAIASGAAPSPHVAAAQMTADCDLARVGDALPLASQVLALSLPMARSVARRRAVFDRLAFGLDGIEGTRVLVMPPGEAPAPYVLAWAFDDATAADAVYAVSRAEGLAVFRWDRVWPGTPAVGGDTGTTWQRCVLQVLCHQDLADAQVEHSVQVLGRAARSALAAPSSTTP